MTNSMSQGCFISHLNWKAMNMNMTIEGQRTGPEPQTDMRCSLVLPGCLFVGGENEYVGTDWKVGEEKEEQPAYLNPVWISSRLRTS